MATPPVENIEEKIVILKALFADFEYSSPKYETSSYKLATQCGECKNLALEFIKDKQSQEVQCIRCLVKEVEILKKKSTVKLDKVIYKRKP